MREVENQNPQIYEARGARALRDDDWNDEIVDEIDAEEIYGELEGIIWLVLCSRFGSEHKRS